MKKIYMILAAITLLSMSLNAQTMAPNRAGYVLLNDDLDGSKFTTGTTISPSAPWTANNVQNQSGGVLYILSGGSLVFTVPSGYTNTDFKFVLKTSTGYYSGYFTFTPSSGTAQQVPTSAASTEYECELFGLSTGNTVTITGQYSSASYSPDFLYMYVYVTTTTPTISASKNNLDFNSIPRGSAIQKVNVTGLNLTDDITTAISGTDASLFSVSPTSLTSSGGELTVSYSPTAIGIHTATLTLSSIGAQDASITLNGTCSNVVTVCDGTTTNGNLPVLGNWFEKSQINQMVYPSSMLTDLNGKKITSMTFYPQTSGSYSGIRFYDGSVTFSLGNLSVNTPEYDSSPVRKSGYEPVATIEMPGERQESLTEWEIEFDPPFEYNGGDLLIDVATVAGTFGATYFYGIEPGSYQSYYSRDGGTPTREDFLPKVTFTFEDNNAPALTVPSSVDVGVNYGSGVYTDVTVSGRNLNETLNVSVTGTGFSVLPTTLNAADVNAGTTVRVTYNGTDPNATGTLTISSSEVSATVNLTATVPELTAPTTGTTINVGTNEGSGASTTVNVSGNHLTEALTVSCTGTGFSVSPSSISAADANAGTTITVTYNGTDPNATGTLTIGSSQASVTVDLTASYIYHAPELTAPVNGSTVDVGTNTGNGVTKTINIKGNYLTQDLTVSVSGRGFSVSRDVTISAADANAGTDVTVTYNGTKPNASGTLTISSNEVSASVHLTASYSNSGDLTICEGTATSQYLPIYAYYYDDCQKNQMIYPATMIEDLVGKTITSMTFYANSDFNWSGGQVTARLGTTTDQSSYSSKTRLQPSDMKIVASGFDVPSGGNTWTIVFTTPFEYNGGNLIVDMEETSHSTGSGSYSSSSFRFNGESRTGGGFYSNAEDYIANFSTVYSGGSVQNFLPKVTFTYKGEEEQTAYSTDGIIRMGNLIIVDQFWASTAENTHPEQYSYILRYTPAQGDPKESSPKTVEVEHTKSVANGFYTEQDVKNDSLAYNTVIPDKLTAQMEMTLPDNDNEIYYVRLQGKENAVPQEAAKVKDNSDMIAKLQLTSGEGGFYYIDQIPESHPEYTPGIVNRFMDNDDPGTGTYGSYKTYVPSVMTYGYDRRYFADDTLHNTYGAPIWRTSVGKVNVHSAIVERQIGKYGSANWEAPGTVAGSPDQVDPDNTVPASIVLLHNVQADGFLPKMSVANVEYVPYKFHVYVYSASGKLRGYIERAAGEDGMSGTHVINDDNYTNYTGPICIYSKDVSNETVETLPDENNDGKGVTLVIPLKQQGSTEWEGYPSFGALDSAIPGDGQQINENDLQIFIRFYYKSAGNESPSEMRGAGDVPDAQMYYGSEGKFNPSGWTALNEIVNSGHVVGVTYVNPQGMQSDRPFEGLNIVITHYSDGSTTTTKVIK